jgi:hypothetical protein
VISGETLRASARACCWELFSLSGYVEYSWWACVINEKSESGAKVRLKWSVLQERKILFSLHACPKKIRGLAASC